MRPAHRPCAIAAALVTAAVTGCAGAPTPSFDLQAHRGGLGLIVENTLPAFAQALELGVSTLELDVAITEDGAAVVTHDRRVSDTKCRDTAPSIAGDPEFPYVGRYVNTLSLAQVRTLDCGSLRQPAHPEQRLVPGERMPLLREVFALVERYQARQVMLNVETKVEAGAPAETAPREQFVQVVVGIVRECGMAKQVTIQSFDWGVLTELRQVAPELPTVALTDGQTLLEPGQPGASPWLGGLDIDDFTAGGRSLQQAVVTAADSLGADAVSPVHGDPARGSVTDSGYRPFTTPEMIEAAHRTGMLVIPWTVNDPATMEHLIGIGVDGLITDRPDMLRRVLGEQGRPLPAPIPPPPA